MSIRKSHCAGRQTVLIAFLLLSLLFSFSFAASASADEVFEFTTISGTVKDSGGHGLEGVRVQLYSITEAKMLNAVFTDANGSWQSLEYDPIEGYTYTVSFYKEGYTFNWGGQYFTTGTGGTTLAAVTGTSKVAELSCVPEDYTYTSDTVKQTSTVTKYNGSAAAVMVPAELGGYPVVSIASSAFYGNKTLTEVWLPENVTSIGNSAFAQCSNLADVNLPNGLNTIGNNCFSGCTSLTEIALPDSVSDIYYSAFDGCSALSAVNFPLNLSSTGSGIFSGCTSLHTITVPEGVTTLPNNVFSDAAALTEIVLPESLTKIGNSSFYRINTLTSITVPENVTSIGNSAFAQCKMLTDVNLPEGLTTIGNNCFSGCENLLRIHLPDSVSDIYYSAFDGCLKLRTVNYPASLASTGSGIFANCPALRTISVPEGVTALPTNVFSDANGLVTVYLPSTLKTVGSSAFYGCSSLRHIALPAGVTSVGNSAFGNCPQMETLVVYAMKTQFGNDAIRDVPLLTIYGWNNSDAILYAIQNGIPFELIGESGDYSGYIVDMAQTSFTADASSLEAGQTVTFTLHYVLKTPLPSNLDELRLTVGLSNTLDADLSSVRLNGSVVEDATLDGSLLTVPVSSGVTSGTLVFSAEASGTNASAFAQMLYSVNDTEKADTLGTLEIDGSAFVGGYSYALLEKTAAGATVLLHNGQSQSDEILVILAAYGEDGHMLCVKVQELAVSAGENVTLTLPLTADDPVSTLKAFTVRPGTYSPLRSAWAYHFAG